LAAGFFLEARLPCELAGVFEVVDLALDFFAAEETVEVCDLFDVAPCLEEADVPLAAPTGLIIDTVKQKDSSRLQACFIALSFPFQRTLCQFLHVLHPSAESRSCTVLVPI